MIVENKLYANKNIQHFNYSGFKTWNGLTQLAFENQGRARKEKKLQVWVQLLQTRDWKIWIIFIKQAIAWSIIFRWPNNNKNVHISWNRNYKKNILLIVCNHIYVFNSILERSQCSQHWNAVPFCKQKFAHRPICHKSYILSWKSSST